MNNILLIIQREYVTRVKKKSFIVMTILGPLLMGLMYAGVIWAAVSSVNQKKIEVLDESKLFEGKFKPTEEFLFVFKKEKIEDLKKSLKGSDFDALVHIPRDVLENPKSIKIYSEKGVTLELQSRVESALEREIENIKLTEAGITKSVLESAKMDVSSETISLKEGGEKKSSAAAASIIGGICAFLIYLSVFIYGAQVMRSITEEKTSRIVEILISSVKPFQLMIGKIIGVALVGLTQFGLWIVLSAGILTFGSKLVGEKLIQSKNAMTEAQMASLPPEAQEMAKEKMQTGGGIPSEMMPDFFGALDTLPLTTIIISFLFYFVGGYLLYSALFGAVGSAVEACPTSQVIIF